VLARGDPHLDRALAGAAQVDDHVRALVPGAVHLDPLAGHGDPRVVPAAAQVQPEAAVRDAVRGRRRRRRGRERRADRAGARARDLQRIALKLSAAASRTGP
jgi:hypothetical protein